MLSLKLRSALRSIAPVLVGVIPQIVIVSVLAAAPWCLSSCVSGDAQVGTPVVLGMTNTIAPFYQDEQLTLYEVQIPVRFPVRRMLDGERTTGTVEPYPRAPFLLASDERVEVHFTLSNLDDQPHNVEIVFDPWNEFVRYRPGVTQVSDEESVPNFSGWQKLMVVPAKSRIVGTLTPDDIQEMAIDLATVQAILAKPAGPNDNPTGMVNRAFNIQNRSNNGDLLLTPLLPKVIAGLTGFDLGLRTMEPANVAVEIIVDVTDLNGNRILAPGAKDSDKIPMPATVLSPPGAR